MRSPFRSWQWIAAAAAILVPAISFADTPSFNNLTGSDYEKIVKELSANFSYSTLTPASSLGGLWGFEFGVVGGVTKTPEILNLVKRTNANFKESKFPHAGALLRVGAPLGFTGELVILPKIKASDLDIQQYGGSVMWTATDVAFPELPVTVAVKGYLNKTKLGFSQTINNSSTGNISVPARLDFSDTLLGAQILVSKKFLVFEPYLGLGYAKADGTLTISSPNPLASIFLGGGSSATSKPTSAQLMAGVDVRLLFIALGAEYQRAFGTDSISGRLSFRF